MTRLYAVDCFPKNTKDATEEQENWWFTVHWSTHLKGEQSEAEKCRFDVDRLQKSLWYGPENLYNRLLENVQDIQKVSKFIPETMIKL